MSQRLILKIMQEIRPNLRMDAIECKPGNVRCGERCFPAGHKCGGKEQAGSAARRLRVKKLEEKHQSLQRERKKIGHEMTSAANAITRYPAGTRAHAQAKQDLQDAKKRMSMAQSESQKILQEFSDLRK